MIVKGIFLLVVLILNVFLMKEVKNVRKRNRASQKKYDALLNEQEQLKTILNAETMVSQKTNEESGKEAAQALTIAAASISIQS